MNMKNVNVEQDIMEIYVINFYVKELIQIQNQFVVEGESAERLIDVYATILHYTQEMIVKMLQGLCY
jgi:hypothetical protein